MKIKFQPIKDKILKTDWTPVKKGAKKVVKYTAIATTSLLAIAYYQSIDEKQSQKIKHYQNLVKELDEKKYNELNESIVIEGKFNHSGLWEDAYNEINDSIRIAERAYALGAQSVRDTFKKTEK